MSPPVADFRVQGMPMRAHKKIFAIKNTSGYRGCHPSTRERNVPRGKRGMSLSA